MGLRRRRSLLRRRRPRHPEPLWVSEAAGLEHLRPVPPEPAPSGGTGRVQQQPRARVPPVPRSVREDEGAPPRVHILRAAGAARALHLPLEAGVGQPGRPDRAAPSCLRGERGLSWEQPVRLGGHQDLPEGGQGVPGEGEGDPL